MNILILHSCVCNGQDVKPGRVLFDVPEHEAAVVIGAGYAQKVEDALPEPEEPFGNSEQLPDILEKKDEESAGNDEETPETPFVAPEDANTVVDTPKKKTAAKTARKTKKK
jgi:outer membrane biosynthesis protein TonB